ncbi:lipase member H-A-like isoform X2 [Aricia agestis]|uniref:lipase member H-A-like isoform X2 n=1 Tax=Aricia agestis TaxID=91739 RepID=UPI001C203482|nr:lipase member H-A-like isoform X2 [Aricia agestis]
MPEGEGVPHLLDLETPAERDALAIRSGIDNQYWLYTRRNPHHAQTLIHNSVKSIWASNYNGAAPTKVIVHGWTGSGNSSMNPLITDAFLAVSDCNVIVVDWNSLASRCYTTAVLGVPDVGEYLGNFLIWLFDIAGGDWNELHLVGFSLGAHVVGNAGRTASGRPGRVTGLDPALPLWCKNPDRLGTDSAVYVEIIHTDGGVLGFMKPIGHVDFYPNGGTNPQPGCWCSTCSHFRAPELFASSVKNNHFVGHRCANLIAASIGYCQGETLQMGNDDMDKRRVT